MAYQCVQCKEHISVRGRQPKDLTCSPCRSVVLTTGEHKTVRTRLLDSVVKEVTKKDFSILDHNRQRIKFYREVLDEVERMNENLEGQIMFNDLLDKELKRRRDE